MLWSAAIMRIMPYNLLKKGIKLHLSSLVSRPVFSFGSILQTFWFWRLDSFFFIFNLNVFTGSLISLITCSWSSQSCPSCQVAGEVLPPSPVFMQSSEIFLSDNLLQEMKCGESPLLKQALLLLSHLISPSLCLFQGKLIYRTWVSQIAHCICLPTNTRQDCTDLQRNSISHQLERKRQLSGCIWEWKTDGRGWLLFPRSCIRQDPSLLIP